MFINKEEKLEVKATGRKRISFIKKVLHINNIKIDDIFFIEWYWLCGTTLRRKKILVKCNDCGKNIKKRICDLNINDDIHYCLSCSKRGNRNPQYGKPIHKNTQKGLKKWQEENENPFTWESSKKKIREKNGWKKGGEKRKGIKRGPHTIETRKKISASIKKIWESGAYNKIQDKWGNIQTKIYKNIEYQSSYELKFLKYIETLKLLDSVERGPKIRYVNKDGENKIYFSDFRLKNSDIIFEIKSSYVLELHKENYILKEAAANKKYDYNLVLNNNFEIVDKKINQYKEIYKFLKIK